MDITTARTIIASTVSAPTAEGGGCPAATDSRRIRWVKVSETSSNIASGGAGRLEDFAPAVDAGADARARRARAAAATAAARDGP